jgi:hypothetical protein
LFLRVAFSVCYMIGRTFEREKVSQPVVINFSESLKIINKQLKFQTKSFSQRTRSSNTPLIQERLGINRHIIDQNLEVQMGLQ